MSNPTTLVRYAPDFNIRKHRKFLPNFTNVSILTCLILITHDNICKNIDVDIHIDLQFYFNCLSLLKKEKHFIDFVHEMFDFQKERCPTPLISTCLEKISKIFTIRMSRFQHAIF